VTASAAIHDCRQRPIGGGGLFSVTCSVKAASTGSIRSRPSSVKSHSTRPTRPPNRVRRRRASASIAGDPSHPEQGGLGQPLQHHLRHHARATSQIEQGARPDHVFEQVEQQVEVRRPGGVADQMTGSP